LSTSEICKRVKPMGINRMFVWRTVKRLQVTGSINNRPGSGRPRTTRTKDRVKRIWEKIRRNPERSARNLAREEQIDDRSMRRI